MDFWQVLLLLIIVIPLTLIWALAIWDIFTRKGVRSWTRVIWLIVVVVVPVLGALVYVGVKGDAAETTIGLGSREMGDLGTRPPR